MKTDQFDTENRVSEDPCCDEQAVWGKLKILVTKSARWILLAAALVIICLFIMGILFDPAVTRILWLTLIGALLIVVLPLLVFISKWINHCNEEFASENSIENKIKSHE